MANAAADNENVSSNTVDEEEGFQEDDVFSGGFAGKCRDSEWSYNSVEDRWECGEDSAEATETTLTVDFYQLDDTPGGETAGFQINQSELQKWKNADPKITTLTGKTSSGDDEPGIDPLQVEAECWQGGKSERPADTDKSIRLPIR